MRIKIAMEPVNVVINDVSTMISKRDLENLKELVQDIKRIHKYIVMKITWNKVYKAIFLLRTKNPLQGFLTIIQVKRILSELDECRRLRKRVINQVSLVCVICHILNPRKSRKF